MNNRKAAQLLHNANHRPDWAAPTGRWAWYQEWNRTLFLHTPIAARVLRQLVPAELELDLHQGQAWVSVVAFTMEYIRPRALPHFAPISNFHEVNVRTYVTDGTHEGVYFLSIEAGNMLSALLARSLSGLPYEPVDMKRETGYLESYSSQNIRTGNYLYADYKTGPSIAIKTDLDTWLTERYYLFNAYKGRMARYTVHHPEWQLTQPQIIDLQLSYTLGPLAITAGDITHTHYSPGVQVLAWPPQHIGNICSD